METKHTKGQWRIDGNEIIADRTLVLELFNNKDFAPNPHRKDVEHLPPKECADANAKLIAAAPLLLDTLMSINNALIFSQNPNDKGLIEMMEAAIKKATE